MKPISLRLLLVVPFLLQLSAAVGLTGYWSWRNGQAAVRDLAGQLRSEVSDRISQHLDSYLEVPLSLVESNSMALDAELLSLDNREQLRLSFWHKVKTHQIGYLLMGFETGEYLAVGHFFGDDRITVDEVKQANPETGGALSSHLLNNRGRPVEAGADLGPFLAREEGWYKAAVRQGKRTWSPVYNWLVEPYNLSIAISQPIYDGIHDQGSLAEPVLVGTLAAEQQLMGISSFLRDLEVSPNGRTFIVEPNGLLIGSSVAESPFVVTAGEPERLRAQDSRDPLIRATAQFLEQAFTSLDRIDAAQQLEFRHEGDRHYLQVTPWRDELGLDWLSVVIMPEADFMGQIQANARRTWLLCGIALLVATSLGIYTSHWITQPIKQLSEAAEKITERMAQKPQLLDSKALRFRSTSLLKQSDIRFRELSLLATSFYHMADQLADSFERLTYSATHDTLTGLPNRLALEAALKTRLIEQSAFALLFLDLDYFKLVNDSLGHRAGDRLLQAVARRIQRSLGDNDVVARFGGDEFVLLLAPRPDEQMATRAVAIANRMIEQLQRPFSLEGRDVFIGTSIGIVDGDPLSGERWTTEDALRSADTALYQAKAKGKGQYAIFDIEMYRQMKRRLQLEMDLHQAIQSEQLMLYYQPLIESASGKICGFEALVRWWDVRTQSMISPSEFIPIAEETGLILPLTEWVLREACQQLRLWQTTLGLGDALVMHVNVASQQFLQPHWVASLKALLAETGLPPHCLGLELTERTLMNRCELMQSVLKQLAEAGIQISIDDFGTGYSSLAYLQQFAIHTIKLDRSFIQPLEQQTPENDAIVRAIVAMAHALGLGLVAEGIESETQRQALVQMGCQQMQGFYFAKPSPAAEIQSLLMEQQEFSLPFSHASSATTVTGSASGSPASAR